MQTNPTAEDLELFHYGIKGMKWGVRRKEGSDGTVGSRLGAGNIRQKKADGSVTTTRVKKGEMKKNPDGSLGFTSKRAAKNVQKRYDKTNPSEDHKKATSLKSRSVSSLSNQELRDVNKRLDLEQNYARLTNKPSTLQKGIKYTQTGLTVVGLATAAYKLKDNELVKVVKNTYFK